MIYRYASCCWVWEPCVLFDHHMALSTTPKHYVLKGRCPISTRKLLQNFGKHVTRTNGTVFMRVRGQAGAARIPILACKQKEEGFGNCGATMSAWIQTSHQSPLPFSAWNAKKRGFEQIRGQFGKGVPLGPLAIRRQVGRFPAREARHPLHPHLLHPLQECVMHFLLPGMFLKSFRNLLLMTWCCSRCMF